MDIADENLVWLVGVGGRVWKSADGGRSWQVVSRIPYNGHVEFISFLDDQTGWAASAESNQMWTTGDGGQTWEEVDLPGGMRNLVAIAVRTPDDGYLIENTGVLYITHDGGQSWSSRTLGLDNESLVIPVLTPSAAICIREC